MQAPTPLVPNSFRNRARLRDDRQRGLRRPRLQSAAGARQRAVKRFGREPLRTSFGFVAAGFGRMSFRVLPFERTWSSDILGASCTIVASILQERRPSISQCPYIAYRCRPSRLLKPSIESRIATVHSSLCIPGLQGSSFAPSVVIVLSRSRNALAPILALPAKTGLFFDSHDDAQRLASWTLSILNLKARLRRFDHGVFFRLVVNWWVFWCGSVIPGTVSNEDSAQPMFLEHTDAFPCSTTPICLDMC